MKPSEIGRAVLKLALFVFFVNMFVRPVAVLVISMFGRSFAGIVGMIDLISSVMGNIARYTVMYIGMYISFAITQKFRSSRVLQIVTGLASMAGAYWLANYALGQVASWMAALLSGMLAAALIVTIALTALSVFLWAAEGPWAFIAYTMLKNDRD